ncbi:hypothetical protein [Nocardia sp. alder85J]|uniref:hypothetical protein n=1 Tax=Nocardia sp. alder85J TaxID=2862949 RepID=UPI001CD6412C|nr:hypothetical protein [Nocardia sp. alder85J]MCX4096459.1 hypothetical protein [Nocardia sp. alder85J]
MVFVLGVSAAWLACVTLFMVLTGINIPDRHPRHRASGRPTVAEIERRLAREWRDSSGRVSG